MSCANLARHIISTFGRSASPDERRSLRAAFDAPAALRAGETREALHLEAKTLILTVKALGAAIPEHLNVEGKTTQNLIRLGRLARALAALDDQRRALSQPAMHPLSTP